MDVAGASLPHLGPRPAACDKHVLSVHLFTDKTVQSCVTYRKLADSAGVGVGFAVIYRVKKFRFQAKEYLIFVKYESIRGMQRC